MQTALRLLRQTLQIPLLMPLERAKLLLRVQDYIAQLEAQEKGLCAKCGEPCDYCTRTAPDEEEPDGD